MQLDIDSCYIDFQTAYGTLKSDDFGGYLTTDANRDMVLLSVDTDAATITVCLDDCEAWGLVDLLEQTLAKQTL